MIVVTLCKGYSTKYAGNFDIGSKITSRWRY